MPVGWDKVAAVAIWVLGQLVPDEIPGQIVTIEQPEQRVLVEALGQKVPVTAGVAGQLMPVVALVQLPPVGV